jgi:hemoglobin-like flavoprotein
VTAFDPPRQADVIIASLEALAEQVGDPTALVYARLFAASPEMEALFVRDVDGAVRGQMLQQVFDILIDHVGRRSYSANLIRAEVVNHENLGVPPAVFATFFRTVMEAVRAGAGARWTPETATAWDALLADLDRVLIGHSSLAC